MEPTSTPPLDVAAAAADAPTSRQKRERGDAEAPQPQPHKKPTDRTTEVEQRQQQPSDGKTTLVVFRDAATQDEAIPPSFTAPTAHIRAAYPYFRAMFESRTRNDTQITMQSMVFADVDLGHLPSPTTLEWIRMGVAAVMPIAEATATPTIIAPCGCYANNAGEHWMHVDGCAFVRWSPAKQAAYVVDILDALTIAGIFGAQCTVTDMLVAAFAWHYIRANCVACTDAIDRYAAKYSEEIQGTIDALRNPESNTAHADLLAAIVFANMDAAQRLWTCGLDINRHVKLYPTPHESVREDVRGHSENVSKALTQSLYGAFCKTYPRVTVMGEWKEKWTGAVVVGPFVSSVFIPNGAQAQDMHIHCDSLDTAIALCYCSWTGTEVATMCMRHGIMRTMVLGPTRGRAAVPTLPTAHLPGRHAIADDETIGAVKDDVRSKARNGITKLARVFRPYGVFMTREHVVTQTPTTVPDVAYVYPNPVEAPSAYLEIPATAPTAMPMAAAAAATPAKQPAILTTVGFTKVLRSFDGASNLDCLYNMPVADQVAFEPSTESVYGTLRSIAAADRILASIPTPRNPWSVSPDDTRRDPNGERLCHYDRLESKIDKESGYHTAAYYGASGADARDKFDDGFDGRIHIMPVFAYTDVMSTVAACRAVIRHNRSTTSCGVWCPAVHPITWYYHPHSPSSDAHIH